jgi:hypothetical protein
MRVKGSIFDMSLQLFVPYLVRNVRLRTKGGRRGAEGQLVL